MWGGKQTHLRLAPYLFANHRRKPALTYVLVVWRTTNICLVHMCAKEDCTTQKENTQAVWDVVDSTAGNSKSKTLCHKHMKAPRYKNETQYNTVLI